jgi:hypothetical protein
LNSKGKQGMIFQDPYDNSGFYKKQIVFNTHQELDNYIYSLLKINIDDLKGFDKAHDNFLKNYPEEYYLLKSYDRAFWMVYIKIEKQIDEIEGVLNEGMIYYDDYDDKTKNYYDDFNKKLKILKEKKSKYVTLENKNHKDKCLCFFKDPRETKTLKY